MMVRTRTREAFPGWERSVRRGGDKESGPENATLHYKVVFLPGFARPMRCHGDPLSWGPAAMGGSRRLGPVPEHAMPVGELFSAAPRTRPRNATAASGRD